MADAKPVDVKNYFGYPDTTTFMRDWKSLTDKDKADLKKGIGDGSLNY